MPTIMDSLFKSLVDFNYNGSTINDKLFDYYKTRALRLGAPAHLKTIDDFRNWGQNTDLNNSLPKINSYRTNLCTNPNMETAGVLVTTRTNLCTNPSLETGLAGWSTAGGVLSNPVSGGFVGSRLMRATANASAYCVTGYSPDFPIIAGTPYALSLYVRGPVGFPVTIRGSWIGAAGVVEASVTTTSLTNYQRVSISGIAPAGVTAIHLDWYFFASVAGDWIEADAVLVEIGPSVVGTYFDGATLAAGDFTYSWSGAANASTSFEKALSVANWVVGGSVQFQSAVWAATAGGKSIAISPAYSSNDTFAGWNNDVGGILPGIVAGNTYTISGTVNTPIAQTGIITGLARIITIFINAGAGYINNLSPAGPAVGSGRVSVTFTAPVGMTECFVRFYNGAGNSSANLVYWDEITIEQSESSQPYFDGNTVPTSSQIIKWDGAVNNSISRLLEVS